MMLWGLPSLHCLLSVYLFAVSIFILAGMFWQAQRNLRKLLNDPYKITPPFKAVYSDLKKGYYYIFVLHQHAFIRSSRRMMPNLDLINGMECFWYNKNRAFRNLKIPA